MEHLTVATEGVDAADRPDGSMKAASKLGAEGWELVSVSDGRLYFRRQKSALR